MRRSMVFLVIWFCLGLTFSTEAQQRRRQRPAPRKISQPTTKPPEQNTKPAVAASPGDPLSGEWDFSRKVLAETAKFKLRLKLTGDRVTGALESSEGSKPIVRGSWLGGKLEIAYGDPNDPAVMTGSLREGELWGRITLSEKEKIYIDKLTGVWMAKKILTPKEAAALKQQSLTSGRIPASSQIKKIGIIYSKLVPRFNGTEQLVSEKIRKSLQEKTSASSEKLPVVILKSLDEAAKEGVDVVFSLEYREEIGKASHSAMMGNLTNLYGKFTRLDHTKVVTTWDKLNIEDTGEFADWTLPYSNFGIGGPMADLSLYRICSISFESQIPTLEIEGG